MPRKKSSRDWLQQHLNDKYVKLARQQGYRSRAAFKLLEIHDKYTIFKAGQKILDLGCSPGSWCQVAQRRAPNCQIIACDLLPMKHLNNVDFVQGDFSSPPITQQIIKILDGGKANLILSDMAPNLSGIKNADVYASQHLTTMAINLATQVLQAQGSFLCKAFQGAGIDEMIKELRAVFKQLIVHKPAASRNKSREVYLLGIGFKPQSS